MEACVGCDEGEASSVEEDGHTVVAQWSAGKTRQMAGDEVRRDSVNPCFDGFRGV